MLPELFIDSLETPTIVSPLHDGKRDNLTGVKKVALSKQFVFKTVHTAARANKVTLNDLLTSCLSVAVKRYFSEQDPTSE
jgi:hypothetical protein